MCCGVVRCVPVEIHLQDKYHLFLHTKVWMCAWIWTILLHFLKYSYSSRHHKYTRRDAPKFWKLHNEDFQLEKSSLAAHLLLLQLHFLQYLLRAWKLFIVQFSARVWVHIWPYLIQWLAQYTATSVWRYLNITQKVIFFNIFRITSLKTPQQWTNCTVLCCVLYLSN